MLCGLMLFVVACGYRVSRTGPGRVEVEVRVDGSRSAGELDHAWEYITGSGNAALYIRPGWNDRILAHLKDVHDHLGIQTVRFHGIFLDEVGVYQGPGRYNFANVDKIYDAILATGVKPFVELSFMPEALAACDKHGFPRGYRPNICPPANYEEWGRMIEAFARHVEERYGAAEVRTWQFEVWNEPNLAVFWGGSKEDYFQLYRVTASALKAVDPELKVGGPATSAAADPWIWDLASFCRDNQLPLDFITTHGYSNERLRPFLQDTRAAGLDPVIVPEQGFYYNELRLIRQILTATPYPAAPVYLTEWNSSVAYSYKMNLWPNDHDLPNDAAYMCAGVKKANGYSQGFSHWTHSDVFEEWGLPGEQWPVKNAAFHGGFGLITIDGIHKPSYHAFAFLHRMGRNLLDPQITAAAGAGVDALVTLDNGELRALVWNHLDTIKQQRASGPLVKATITFVNLPESARNKTLHAFRIDVDHGNPFAEWLDMGQPGQLSTEQADRLKKLSDNTLADPGLQAIISGPELSLDFELPPAAVVFFTTDKEGL